MIDRDYVGHPSRRITPKVIPVRPVVRIDDRSRFKLPEQEPPPVPRPILKSDDMFVSSSSLGGSRGALTNPEDVAASQSPEIIRAEPYAQPAQPKQQSSQVLKRESVVAPIFDIAKTDHDPRPRFPFPSLQKMMIGMAFVVFAAGIFVSVQAFMVNGDAKSQVSALSKKAVTASNKDSAPVVPTESKPSSKGGGRAYQVAPNVPKYLKIPKLNVNARVSALGLDSSNALKAPYNIYDAGWYDASARPGDDASLGAVLIDGHVHGPTKPGVFVGLKKLVVGDTIQIVRGDNQVFTYQVSKVQNYDANTMDMGMMLTSAQPGKPGLNLITCGGPYDHKTGEYTERTAVFAVQL